MEQEEEEEEELAERQTLINRQVSGHLGGDPISFFYFYLNVWSGTLFLFFKSF